MTLALGDDARWLVDGMNVIGSRPDGWWADRTGAMVHLVDLLNAFRTETGEGVVVVLDGRPRDEVTEEAGDGVEVRFAPGKGPDRADDVIAELVREAPEPHRLTVVTSDQELERRVREAGAAVTGGGGFRDRLEELAG